MPVHELIVNADRLGILDRPAFRPRLRPSGIDLLQVQPERTLIHPGDRNPEPLRLFDQLGIDADVQFDLAHEGKLTRNAS